MNLQKTIAVLTFTIFACSTFAQKISVEEGKTSALSGINEVTIQYDFSEISVGKFDNEQDYLDHRSAEMNEEEAEKGDKWVEDWHKDKEENFPRRFEELFSKYSDNISISEGEADVVMIVKTTFIEPGFNVGVMRRPSLVDLTITFKKGEETLAVITINDAPGNAAAGYDFDAGLRIQESYAKAGKEFGKFLTKKVK